MMKKEGAKMRLGLEITLAIVVGFVLIPGALVADPTPCPFQAAAPGESLGFGFLTFLNSQVGSTLLSSFEKGLLAAVLGATTLVGLPVLLAAGVLAASDLPARWLRNGRG